MTDSNHTQPADHYQTVGFVALVALTMVLLEKGLGGWALFVAAVGVPGIWGPWRPGGIVFLLILTLAVGAHSRGIDLANVLAGVLGRGGSIRGGSGGGRRVEPLQDLFAAVAVLAYLMAHFRLVSIHKGIFPRDKRKAAPAKRPHIAGGKPQEEGRGGQGQVFSKIPPPHPQPLSAEYGGEGRIAQHKADNNPDVTSSAPPSVRPAGSIRPMEIGILLACLPVFGGFAALFLFGVVRMSNSLILLPEVLRPPFFLLWLTGAVLAAIATVLGYRRRAEAGLEENLLLLQDQLWQQTRREQSRVQRWLAWARLRGQRRKEKS